MLLVAIRACPGCVPDSVLARAQRSASALRSAVSLKPRPDYTPCALILEPSEGAPVAPAGE